MKTETASKTASSEPKNEKTKNGGETQFIERAPEGFEDVGRPEIDGWLKAEEGLVLFGKIAGFFSYRKAVRGQPSKVVEVVCFKLHQSCKAAPDEEGGPARMLQKGQVIAASMMYSLEDIKPYIEHRGDVWIRFGKKVALGGGAYVWKAEVKCRGKKGAIPQAQMQAPPNTESDEFAGVADYEFS